MGRSHVDCGSGQKQGGSGQRQGEGVGRGMEREADHRPAKMQVSEQSGGMLWHTGHCTLVPSIMLSQTEHGK